MRLSPDADAHSSPYKTASHSTHIRQTVLLLALLLAGLVISFVIVRHIDLPRARVVTAPEKSGTEKTPDSATGECGGVLPA